MSFDFLTAQQGFNSSDATASERARTRNLLAAERKEILEEQERIKDQDESQERQRITFAEFVDHIKNVQNQKEPQSAQGITADETQIPAHLTTAANANTLPFSPRLISEGTETFIDKYSSTDLVQTDLGGDDVDALQHLIALTVSTEVQNADVDAQQGNIFGIAGDGIVDTKSLLERIQTLQNSEELSADELEELNALTAELQTIEAHATNIADHTSRVLPQSSLPVSTEQQRNVQSHINTTNDPFTNKYDGRYDAARTQPAPNGPSSANTPVTQAGQTNANTQHNVQANPQNLATTSDALLQNNGTSTFQSLLTSSSDGSHTLNGFTSGSLTSSPIQGTLVNATAHASHTAQTHPATQLVSVTIQKAMKAGDDTNIKLRLDPADLGRVEVKVSIDKDNTAKIVLTAEKPETFMMLQRDVDTLQRAMEASGLNTEGGLSFELADDDHEFNQNNNGKSSNHASNRADETGDDVIDASMDWHVDPETGRMHYNILA